jgi:dUTPase
MKNKIYITNQFKLQQKQYQKDIGYDVKAISYPEIVGQKYGEYYQSIDYIEYDTGIKIESIQKNADVDMYTLVYPRSSISKKNLYMANSVGLIDPEYRDTIKIRFCYKFQPKDLKVIEDFIVFKIDESKIYKIGDKIGQLVFMQNVNLEIDYVPELMPSARSSGFVSTGE